MEDELRAALLALGVQRVGGLAAFDPGDVEARWGAAGLVAWRLARGDDPRRPGSPASTGGGRCRPISPPRPTRSSRCSSSCAPPSTGWPPSWRATASARPWWR
jgi:hypothetical protein